MRCFYVLVHGRLDWRTEPSRGDEPAGPRPAGFYAHRYLLASNEGEAKAAAFRRVRDRLDEETGWIDRGLAALSLEAEEVAVAPLHKLLKPDSRGHAFYRDD